MLPLRARMNMRVMAMKGTLYSPKVQHHHQIVLCHIQNTCKGGFNPLPRCSHSIMQPQPNGPTVKWFQVLLCNISKSIFKYSYLIQNLSFFCTKLKNIKHHYSMYQVFLSNKNNLHTAVSSLPLIRTS